MTDPHGAIRHAAAVIEDAARVLVLTGAGISTAAGIPDYRGPNGLWTRDPSAERASRADVYRSDALVRRAAWRRLSDPARAPAIPTRAHFALALAAGRGDLLGIVTQNVDGLHRAAGTPPERLVEIHGRLDRTRCLTCGARGPTDRVVHRVRRGDPDPRCEETIDARPCGGVLSVDIVRFGDALDPADWERAIDWFARADLLLAVGSTLSVRPVAQLADDLARSGRDLVIVNAEPTRLDDVARLVVRGDIDEIVPSLLVRGTTTSPGR